MHPLGVCSVTRKRALRRTRDLSCSIALRPIIYTIAQSAAQLSCSRPRIIPASASSRSSGPRTWTKPLDQTPRHDLGAYSTIAIYIVPLRIIIISRLITVSETEDYRAERIYVPPRSSMTFGSGRVTIRGDTRGDLNALQKSCWASSTAQFGTNKTYY